MLLNKCFVSEYVSIQMLFKEPKYRSLGIFRICVSSHYQTHIANIERLQRRFTGSTYGKSHYPSEINHHMRYIRLELLSLEDR